MATMPQHPLYKQLPVIPGDHAYNIAVAAVGLVLDKEPTTLLALRDHTLGGQRINVPVEALIELFDVIAHEAQVDVLGFLVKDATGVQPTGELHKPKGLRFPDDQEQQAIDEQERLDAARQDSIYGQNPNFW